MSTVEAGPSARRLAWRAQLPLLLALIVAGVALAFVHAYQMGTDGTERAFRIGMLLLVAIGTYTLFIRLVGVLVQRRDAARAG